MELISKDTAIRVVDSGRNRQQLVDMMKAVPPVNAIEIPEGATNGDMIKAMFPNEEIIESDGACVYVGAKMRFDKDWWNAPYKGVEG